MTSLIDLATHFKQVVLKKSLCSFSWRSPPSVASSILVSIFAIPSRQMNKCKKLGWLYLLVILSGSQRDQSGTVAPVVKKKDRAAQDKPHFKMQNKPTSSVFSNKGAIHRWMSALPPFPAIKCVLPTPVNLEYVVQSPVLPSFLSSYYTVLIPVHESMS